jgi:hypothetical protein
VVWGNSWDWLLGTEFAWLETDNPNRCTAAGDAGNVRVAYCWMIGSTKDERTAIESDLIKFYKPECNIAYNSFAWWLSRTTPVAPGIPGGYGSLLDMLVRTKLT